MGAVETTTATEEMPIEAAIPAEGIDG